MPRPIDRLTRDVDTEVGEMFGPPDSGAASSRGVSVKIFKKFRIIHRTSDR
jgi:hypothetical protein